MMMTGLCPCRLQKPNVAADTGDAPLRYTARSSGNCLDFNFPRQPRTTQTPSASPGAPPTQAPKQYSLGASMSIYLVSPHLLGFIESRCQGRGLCKQRQWWARRWHRCKAQNTCPDPSQCVFQHCKFFSTCSQDFTVLSILSIIPARMPRMPCHVQQSLKGRAAV